MGGGARQAAIGPRPPPWGRAVLGPLIRPDVQAGSVFLDGRGGHVIAVAPPADRDGHELTIEAWARVLGLSGRGDYLLQVVPAQGEEVLTPVGVHRAPSDLPPDPARP